jgi:hypothetical protein
MRLKTNFKNDGQSGTGFGLIPEGVYDAKVFGMDPVQASTGTEGLNIEFEIIGPIQTGRHVWGNLYFTEKAGWKFAALCNAVGIPASEELETRDLLGKTLRVVVKHVAGSDGVPRAEAVGFRKSKLVPTAA